MQTLTIKIDDSYLDKVLGFLQTIPKSKREILQHTHTTTPQKNEETTEDDFLTFLRNGPTISEQDARIWEQSITDGYKNWNIETF